MHVLSVTPLSAGIFKDQLSYFSVAPVPIGAIVTIPVKSRSVLALVTDCRPAADLKSELRTGDFALKKISAVKDQGLFRPEFLSAAGQTAAYFGATLGQTLKSALPQVILNDLSGCRKIELSPEADAKPQLKNGVVKQNKFLLQDTAAERLSYYKALVRESFAKKESVLLCVPVSGDVPKVADVFGPGLRDFTVSLHSELPKKTLFQNWNRVAQGGHPLLVIITPGFLAVPRGDIGLIILDKESHSSYKQISRPRIDFRFLAEKLSEALSARLVLGDLVLRAETIFRAERGDLGRLSSLKFRAASAAEQLLVTAESGHPGDKTAYAVGGALRRALHLIFQAREKIIILSGRKGLHSITVCGDCGETVRCEHCGSPLHLHKDPGRRSYYYLCHKCGQPAEVSDKCRHCDSWRLALLGAGLDKVREEVTEQWPTVPLFCVDSSTPPAARQTAVKKFYDTRGAAMLIGTEAIIPLLSAKVANVAVVAIDALFSLPDFRISEKVLNMLLSLREFAGTRFIIQTRNPEEKVFRYAATGNLIDFYRDEIEERRHFGYPPFRTLIKVSRLSKAETVGAEVEKLADWLADYRPAIFPVEGGGGRVQLNAILKVAPAAWPSAELESKLKALIPEWQVEIEPESII
jgi:primosomal protein N' (replication factor Y)